MGASEKKGLLANYSPSSSAASDAELERTVEAELARYGRWHARVENWALGRSHQELAELFGSAVALLVATRRSHKFFERLACESRDDAIRVRALRQVAAEVAVLALSEGRRDVQRQAGRGRSESRYPGVSAAKPQVREFFEERYIIDSGRGARTRFAMGVILDPRWKGVLNHADTIMKWWDEWVAEKKTLDQK